VLQVRGHDRYGRVTAQLATPSGRDIGEQMIVQGWAMWDKRYAPQATAYGLAEIEARARRHGMWTTPAPIPPWQWRQGVRELSLKKSS
jgi:endonuclease YncB( thermonuclease family)